MVVTAKDVMSLRQRTGMGMMECKAALSESGGDFDKAVEILRVAAKGKMDERADRAAAEGVVAVAKNDDSTAAALIELNCETDFVARNDAFVAAADAVAQIALTAADGPISADDKITQLIDDLRVTTKENVSFARGVKVTAPAGGSLGSYVHHNRQIGAIVVLDGSADEALLKGLSQHVAAAVPVPTAVDEAGLPADQVEKARGEFVAEAQASGKPAEIAEKIASGRMKKWVDERTLLGQLYLADMDSKKSVREHLPKGVNIVSFHRFQVGVK